MNAERLQDAMNFLDDDLIEETDALRRGERVLPRKPRVLRWVVPAACLALAIGVASMAPILTEGTKSDCAIFEEQAEFAPGSANRVPESAEQDAMESSWKTVTCGGISLELPPDWEYELSAGTDETVYISFGPAGDLALRVGFDSCFGVCGTGLEEADTTIAGMPARVGYYDSSQQWSFAVFTQLEPSYVIINDANEAWWSTHGHQARAVLDTITISEES